jgi:hypothetical protein
MDERRTTGEVLSRLRGSVQDDEATNIELLAKTRISDSRNRGFRKRPDIPLGAMLKRKAEKKSK